MCGPQVWLLLPSVACLLLEIGERGPGVASLHCSLCAAQLPSFIHPLRMCSRCDLRTGEYWKDGIAFKVQSSESFLRNFPGIFGNQQQHYLDVIKRMLVQCMQDQEHPSVKHFTSISTSFRSDL